MSNFIPTHRLRHPLGLPAGSVRSVLTLLIVGMICALVLVAPPTGVKHLIPPYLIYLMFLILGSFFAAHGATIDRANSEEPSALYLPRGLIRLLIIGILIATIVWTLINRPEEWQIIFNNSVDEIKKQPYLGLFIIGGFVIGLSARLVFGGGNNQSPVYQDVIAWFSLVAIVGLIIQIVIDFLIKPTLAPENQFDLPSWEGILAGIVAFYFAARS
jgi:hypothetical protein